MPPIFSSKSVSPTARVIISFVPIANSPTRRAPSSVSSRESSTSSPTAADASTTTPASKRRRTSRHVRPSSIEGTSNVISPSTPPGGGQQKTSPSGRFISPAQDSQARPSTFTRRSVPAAGDAQLAHAGEPLDQARIALAQRAPGRHRVGLVEQQCRVDEALPGGGAHARGLRAERRRIAGAHPAQLAGGLALLVALKADGRRAMAASRALAMPASSAVLPGAHTNSQRSKRSTASSSAGSR